MTAVVVPVFNALAETRRCLEALQACTPAKTPIVVIDDASTEPGIAELMASLPREWVLVRNDKNLGFVASANLGLALTQGEDAVVLNSDTRVTKGWLSAMEDCAAGDDSIASVTPLTNNGEIASVPVFCQANPMPDDPERWARACRESGSAVLVEMPTAVGFCMFLKRACLDAIGAFDEMAFGRGYGEENDWSMRALKTGWRHVLCDHAFVAHQGNASFGAVGLKPGGKAMETLLERHPDYLERVQAFIQADPMAPRRQQIVDYYNTLDP
jgi:GT2 family glycosyltransferase